MEKHSQNVRAGVISLLVLAICYLGLTGLSSLPRVLTFIVLFAVCLVLMLQSMVDLMVWAFGLAARYTGSTAGRSVALFKVVLHRNRS